MWIKKFPHPNVRIEYTKSKKKKGYFVLVYFVTPTREFLRRFDDGRSLKQIDQLEEFYRNM